MRHHGATLALSHKLHRANPLSGSRFGCPATLGPYASLRITQLELLAIQTPVYMNDTNDEPPRIPGKRRGGISDEDTAIAYEIRRYSRGRHEELRLAHRLSFRLHDISARLRSICDRGLTSPGKAGSRCPELLARVLSGVIRMIATWPEHWDYQVGACHHPTPESDVAEVSAVEELISCSHTLQFKLKACCSL